MSEIISTTTQSEKKLMLAGGMLYLIIIVVSIVGELLIRLPMIDPMDWSATTEKIRSNLFMWRAAISLDLLLLISGVGLTYIYYRLFSRDQTKLAVLACCFLVCTFAVELTTKYDLYAISILLEDERYLLGFGQEYFKAQINFHYRSYYLAFQNMMTFYASACFVLAVLAWRSKVFPNWISVAFGYIGISYMIATHLQVLLPQLASGLFPGALSLTYLGEAFICGWLLKGGIWGPE